ncbi:MAG TPA: FAD-binding protein, partial [Planctomycetes bacterium]|nr:FAD-binding protein [Planctomycetota bacterium]
VVPAAHYMCGGVTTDLTGKTSIPGLSAIGECAFTGLHGANRLASNSLLEALAFAKTVSARISQQQNHPQSRLLCLLEDRDYGEPRPHSSLKKHAKRLRRLMWENVGIVRSGASLARAEKRLQELEQRLDNEWDDGRLRPDVLELRNLVTVAQLITASALQRRESRGLHFNRDYPNTHNDARDTALRPD